MNDSDYSIVTTLVVRPYMTVRYLGYGLFIYIYIYIHVLFVMCISSVVDIGGRCQQN